MSTLALRQAQGPRTEPRRRGRLVLADKVVEKVAGQAATEVGATRRRGDRPKVDVALTADSADLALEVAIGYPGSIRRATQEVREHVSRRVLELTGVPVHRVDVEVRHLSVAADPDARREVLR